MLSAAFESIDFNTLIYGINSFVNVIKTLLSQLNDGLTTTFATVFGKIVNAIASAIPIFNLLSPLLSSVINLISRFVTAVSDSVANISFNDLYSTFESVLSILTTLANTVASVFETAFGNIDFGSILLAVKSVASVISQLIVTLGVAIKNVIVIVSEFVKSISVAFSKIDISTVYYMFNSLFNVITKLASVVATTLASAFNAIDFNKVANSIAIVSDIFNRLITQLGGNSESIGSFFGGAINTIADLLPLLNLLSPILSSIISAAKSIGSAFSESFANVNMDSLFGMFGALSTTISSIITTISGLISNLIGAIDFNSIIVFITNILSGINEMISSLGEGGLSTALSSIFAAAQSVMDIFINLWKTISDGFENNTGKTLSFKSVMEELFNFINPILNEFVNSFNSVSVAISDMLSRLDTGKIGNFIKMIQGTILEIQRFVGEITKGFFEAIDLNVIIDGVSSVIQVFKDLLKWLSDSGIFRVIGNLIGLLVNLVGYAGIGFEAIIDKLVQWGRSIGKFFDSIGKGFDKVKSWFGEIFNSGDVDVDSKVKNYKASVNNSSSSVTQENKFNISSNQNMDMRALSREVARLIKSGVV